MYGLSRGTCGATAGEELGSSITELGGDSAMPAVIKVVTRSQNQRMVGCRLRWHPLMVGWMFRPRGLNMI